MEFYEEYFKDLSLDVSAMIPRVQTKYRDTLCFKGRKVDYKDFTKFVKRDNQYYPMLDISDVSDSDLVLDLYPFINIGIAEALTCVHGHSTSQVDIYIRHLCDLCKHFSFEEIEPFIRLLDGDSVLENKENTLVTTTLRSSYCDSNWGIIRRIVCMLNALRLISPRRYCEAVMDAIRINYITCSLFTTPKDRLSVAKVSESAVSDNVLDNFIGSRCLDFNKIGYTIPNMKKKHYITDSRGIGIYTFMNLLFSVYSNFGEILSSSTVVIGYDKEERKEFIRKKINDCIGDDFWGKYLNTGKTRIRPCEDCYIDIYYNKDTRPVDCYDVYDIMVNGSDVKYSRQMYEDKKLFNRAFGVSSLKNTSAEIPFHSTYYCSDTEIRDAILHYNSIDNIETFLTEIDSLKKNKTVKEVVVSDPKVEEKYQAEIVSVKEKAEKMSEDYELRIKELERIISSKSDIIGNLNEKVKSLQNEVSSYYSDADIEELAEVSNVTIEEMVSYLNNFKLCLVGGRMELPSKLEELGFTNFIQIDHRRAVSSTPVACDFFCINTQFISHKLVKSVQESYQNMTSQMFYYNGTNVDYLIRTAYDFISNWMEGSSNEA